MRTLTARTNRKPRTDGEYLKKSRGARMLQECGDHYVISDRNCIVLMHVDLEVGILRPGERLVAWPRPGDPLQRTSYETTLWRSRRVSLVEPNGCQLHPS